MNILKVWWFALNEPGINEILDFMLHRTTIL